jgi:hypothetical protein
MQCRKTCGVHSVLAVAWIGTVLLLTSAQRVRPDLKQLALLVLIDKVDRNTQRLPVVETHPQLHNLISQDSQRVTAGISTCVAEFSSARA